MLSRPPGSSRQEQPDVRLGIPRPAPIVAVGAVERQTGPAEPRGHLRHRQSAKRQREVVARARAAPRLDERLVEEGQAPPPVLA